MSSYADGGINSPPELPQYLKEVCDLKPIVGAPSDQELIGIHSVIRVALKAIDIPGMGGGALLLQLSEHLFNTQIARYRSKYLGAIFPENMTYEPPALPAHLSVQLEPISGTPSDNEIIKIQEAFRSYQHFANASSIFGPYIHLELSQHLFDAQMARYIQRAKQIHPASIPHTPGPIPDRSVKRTAGTAEEEREDTNGVRSGTNNVVPDQLTRKVPDAGVQDSIERSNRLAEQANRLTEQSNLLIDRSNQIAERTNQLVERSNQTIEQSNNIVDRFAEIFVKWSGHFERANHLAETSTQLVEKLVGVLRNINRVLVGIQHAIVRNHKGNTVKAADCLINEKGGTPGQSQATYYASFEWLSEQFGAKAGCELPVVIDGVQRTLHIDDKWLGRFLRFYGACEDCRQNGASAGLKEGYEPTARLLFGRYLSTCLG